MPAFLPWPGESRPSKLPHVSLACCQQQRRHARLAGIFVAGLCCGSPPCDSRHYSRGANIGSSSKPSEAQTTEVHCLTGLISVSLLSSVLFKKKGETLLWRVARNVEATSFRHAPAVSKAPF